MIPLEGIGDYVDISTVVNPWQAAVVCVFIIAVLIWPGVQSILTNRKVKEVQKTLTTNNGGSTVKDQNDRIEKTLGDVVAKLDGHIEWSEGYVQRTTDRLEALEGNRRARWPWRR